MSVLGIALSALLLLVVLAASLYFLFFPKTVKDDSVNREAPRQGVPQQHQRVSPCTFSRCHVSCF